MSYQVLYRRFRPNTFEDIVGQDHITTILKNQIAAGKISHAYLFSGPKGTGKTSAAKVFARAVNCLSPKEGEACENCDYCRGTLNHNISDIIEIDAASNRGIDEIRQLKETVNYLPASGKYRVYIIDEVHMLTAEAFNALLKTLEEPPAHVIFIFATTEQHKVLPTILSRCQRYDFVRIPNDVIAGRVKFVLESIGVGYEEEAVNLIAANSDGALRDALSLTDKILTQCEGNFLDAKTVLDTLGLTGENDIMRMAEAVMDSDISTAFEVLDESLSAGNDLNNITSQLIEYFRNLMIYMNSNNPQRIIAKNSAYIESLKKSSLDASNEGLIASINILSKLKSDARYITQPRYLLESVLLTISNQKDITDYMSVSARLDRLEKKLVSLSEMQSSEPRQPKIKPLGRPLMPEFIELPDEEPFSQDGSAGFFEITDLDNTGSYDSEPVIISDIAKAPPSKNNVQKDTKNSNESLPPTDKELLIKFQDHIEFASNFIHNKDRDIILSDLFSCLKPAAYGDGILYVYPTASAVHMMDVFESKKGKLKLAEIISERIGEKITVDICEGKSTKPKNVIDAMKEIMGDIVELEDNKEN